MKRAYAAYFGRCGDHLPHAALSSTLFATDLRGRGGRAALEDGFNHSTVKLTALQTKYGFQRFSVVFRDSPQKTDTARYCAAGLVWCTLKTLPDLMNTIELLRQGWHVPFIFRRPGYVFTMKPEAGSLPRLRWNS